MNATERHFRYKLLKERVLQIEGELFALEEDSNDRGELKVMEGCCRAAQDLSARLGLLADSTEPLPCDCERQAREALRRIAERQQCESNGVKS